MFSAQTYQERREILKGSVDHGILLFLGNIENPVNFEDNAYYFRQDSTYLYYFGIQEPKIAAIIDIDENKTIVFGDELSIDDIVWMGRQETLKEKSFKAGVQDTLPYSQLFNYIQKVQSSGRKVHYLPPYQSSNKIILSDLLGIKISELQPSVEMIKAIVKQRSVKEAQEIVQIENAVNVSNEMHLLAMRTAKPGIKEYEIANAIQYLAANKECQMSYPPIVTINGGILHNHYRLNTLQSGDLFLNDSGAETAMGYAGDLTRTFPVDNTFSTKQKEMYEIVLNAFNNAQQLLKPGIRFKDIHLKASQYLVEGLIDLGLMKGNPEEAVKNHAHTLFFQCGLGHMMGLDVHDMEDLGEQYVGYTEEEPKDTQTFGLKSLRLGRALEPGFVLTVEPGIYIIPELIDIWQAENKNADFINYDKVNEYRNFGGVRIEDNFLITNDGYRLLGNGLIKTVEEIENYRSEHLS
ncbi:Xaa-Pro aminopeptidase [Chryseobacterium lactis]|uniref:Xaa-Pro aminopeptidase n=1 Tax=Chryseobacterium lactis TaxID=1241981 RepID=A0A3G6RPV2_CHRLC|nr:aminopeptidase P family protein [Chryseobacterium lactis]AZA83669.1 aminopeptidase P family protein [Chryseobacterium lactis]AZB04054.1 aminopeptidase P family protein [Chryseobacterium lactis]PNW13037.1 Xaa-Pro aminopeptidase [Chryseobacterium lactis]